MTEVVFYQLPFSRVLGEWLWIALWVYVGMRIERRRWRKREEIVPVQSVEPTLGEPVGRRVDVGHHF